MNVFNSSAIVMVNILDGEFIEIIKFMFDIYVNKFNLFYFICQLFSIIENNFILGYLFFYLYFFMQGVIKQINLSSSTIINDEIIYKSVNYK